MKLSNGILKRLSIETGIDARHLSGYACTSRRPGRKRARYLEEITNKLGFKVSAELWVFGTSEEIKKALMAGERRGRGD